MKEVVPVTSPVSWTDVCQGDFTGAVIIAAFSFAAGGGGGVLGAGGGHINSPSLCTMDPRMTSSSIFK